jgi:nitroreductase
VKRVAAHPIEPLFVERWSPRAMDGTPISAEELARLFEAARWAPSSGNAQPWRYAFARRGTPAFDAYLDALVEANRAWCVRAGALLIAGTQTMRAPGKPNPTAAFDLGSSWMSLALQGHTMGLVVHAMAGFDNAKARAACGAPAEVEIYAMIAIGHPGPITDLPEKLQARETPSDRNAQDTWAFEGRFPDSSTDGSAPRSDPAT